MNTKKFAALIGIALVATACVHTQDDHRKFGVPFVKDNYEGRYERSVDQVFKAAKDVIQVNGALVNESTLLDSTNAVRTVQGKVNQRNVWVRVEAVDPKPITAVTVQVRTTAGGTDMGLTHELEKQIALKLAQPGR
jgi:hypothetical protein